MSVLAPWIPHKFFLNMTKIDLRLRYSNMEPKKAITVQQHLHSRHAQTEIYPYFCEINTEIASTLEIDKAVLLGANDSKFDLWI